MIKRILAGILSALVLAGCAAAEEKITDSVRFQREYEALNGTLRDGDPDKRYSDVTVGADNPICYVTADEAADLLETTTAAIYFGAAWCPWCRKAVSALLEAAKLAGLDCLYYVDVTDERDVWELQGLLAVQTDPGTAGYRRLLRLLDGELPEYTLSTEGNFVVHTGEKRIMIPYLVTSANGRISAACGLTVTLNDTQTPYSTLTPAQQCALVETLTPLLSACIQ